MSSSSLCQGNVGINVQRDVTPQSLVFHPLEQKGNEQTFQAQVNVRIPHNPAPEVIPMEIENYDQGQDRVQSLVHDFESAQAVCGKIRFDAWLAGHAVSCPKKRTPLESIPMPHHNWFGASDYLLDLDQYENELDDLELSPYREIREFALLQKATIQKVYYDEVKTGEYSRFLTI